MRISVWSSDVCSSDLLPENSGRFSRALHKKSMSSGVCNIVVTKSDYADRKAHYKSGFSESWAVRLLVTIGMPRLSYSVGAKIIFADGAFLRRRFAWAMRRRAVPRKRYKEKFIFDRRGRFG